MLIFDRKEDPVTPLLNQWTYQAMIHELIGIKENKIQLKNNFGKNEEHLLEEWDDKFLSVNLISEIGDVAGFAREEVDKIKSKNEKTETIEDMKKLIESIPQKKKDSAQLTKHVSIIGELVDLYEKNKLIEISNLEQDIAVEQSKDKHYKEVCEVIESNKIHFYEKLKLAILFAFRYEGDKLVISVAELLEKKHNNSVFE